MAKKRTWRARPHNLNKTPAHSLTKKIKTLEDLAQQGDKEALYQLLDISERLDDDAKRFQLTQWGAEQGFAEFLSSLGYLHMKGIGIPVNRNEAFNCFKQAACAGMPRALYNLGQCYQYGHGTHKNPEMALKYFGLAAAKGLPEAFMKLGYCYATGNSTAKNRTQAIIYFEQALKFSQYQEKAQRYITALKIEPLLENAKEASRESSKETPKESPSQRQRFLPSSHVEKPKQGIDSGFWEPKRAREVRRVHANDGIEISIKITIPGFRP